MPELVSCRKSYPAGSRILPELVLGLRQSGLAEYWDSPALRAIRDSPGGGTWPDSGPARVPGLTAPLDHAGTRTGTKRDTLRDLGGDALRGSCWNSHRDSHRDSYRDSWRDKAGRATGLGRGRAAGLLLKLVPELVLGLVPELVLGLVARLEAVLKGNSRVEIGQRRVQHLEKFRLFRVPVRFRFFSLLLFTYFCFFLCTPEYLQDIGGKIYC